MKINCKICTICLYIYKYIYLVEFSGLSKGKKKPTGGKRELLTSYFLETYFVAVT